MKPERCQTCIVLISWSMLSIQKNSSANIEGASTLFQNLSGSVLKPRNSSEVVRFVNTLHRNSLETISNFTTAL